MLRRTPPFRELGKLAAILSVDLKRNAVDLETEATYGAVSNDNSAVLSMTDFMENKAGTFTAAPKTKPNYNLVDLFRHNHTTIIPVTTAPKTPSATASDFISSTADMTRETKILPLNSLNNVTRVADEQKPATGLGSLIGNLSQYEDINVIPITGRTQKLAPTG